MRPDDEWLRDGLAKAAKGAGALGFTADHVVGKVRHRRRRRAVVGAVAAVAVVVLASVLVGSGMRSPRTGALTGGTSETPTVSETSKVYMCGQRLVLPDEAASRGGLTMAISDVRRGAGDTGPDITVTFTATTTMQVISGPPNLFEVLYLRDGIIVGGGPMLNLPGDESLQGLDMIGYGFTVGPDRPSSHDAGRRDTLCPSLTWPDVWSAPQSYEIVMVQGPVTGQPPEMSLGVPGAGQRPLLVSRASLPR
jgi:hypothetical protein